MLKLKKIAPIFASICLGSLCSSFVLSFATVAVADNKSQESREGLPLRRVGGGTRSGCPLASNDRLVALIPESTVSKTTKTNPKFYFYIPENTDGKQLEFVLRDKNDRQVYETTFVSSGKSGIISVELPADKSDSLKANDNYHWYFSLICNPSNRSQDLVLEGSIQRVAIDRAFSQKLENATPMERVKLYQSADIWYDALATLAELKLNSGESAANLQWQALLESIDLVDLARKPLL